jgi:hypothetical protein
MLDLAMLKSDITTLQKLNSQFIPQEPIGLPQPHMLEWVWPPFPPTGLFSAPAPTATTESFRPVFLLPQVGQ